jgi:hypothetical protein
MPLLDTQGNDSADAYGGGVPYVPTYIEQIFSTYLYTGNWAGTGNSNTVTVNNGIDLTGKGGLIWFKERANPGTISPALFDTVRGANQLLSSNQTGGQYDYSGASNSFRESMTFQSNGFTVTKTAIAGGNGYTNYSGGATYASWTFRKQPKFFDIVTYTGDGTNNRAIPHNLGSVPGCVIVKSTTLGTGWPTYHRGMATSNPESWEMYLNTTAARTVNGTWGGAPTSTNFYVNANASVNQGGDSYVAYVFAHNAGGFGLTGTDNVITCDSCTNPSSGSTTVTLGYEPQWIMVKTSDGSSNWTIFDNMRFFSVTNNAELLANSSASENNYGSVFIKPTATGFVVNSGYMAGSNLIYIAIRRGPMAVPTTGTKVFAPVAQNGGGTVTTGFPVDLALCSPNKSASGVNKQDLDRLRGSSTTSSVYINPNLTDAESSQSVGFGFDNNTGYKDSWFSSATAYWNFGRAPGFFDEVCYTGDASGSTQVTHNLGVTPELVICKSRSTAINWSIACNVGGTNYVRGLGSAFGFNSTNAATQTVDFAGVISPTYFKPQTIFGTNNDANQSGTTYVAYLFATCPGVSKIGTYTGNGSTQAISCGFTGGARFVLIKRTDSSGDWYVWDSANGLTSSSSPYITLDTTNAQTTGNNGTYASSGGFTLTSSSPVNASGGTFIFLAIA